MDGFTPVPGPDPSHPRRPRTKECGAAGQRRSDALPESGGDGEAFLVVAADRGEPQRGREPEGRDEIHPHCAADTGSLRITFSSIWFCARNGTANIHSWFLTGLTIRMTVGIIGSRISTVV